MIQISAVELHRLLTADKKSFTQMELAIREAIDEAYKQDEVDINLEKATLEDAILQVTAKGKVSKL